MAISGTREESLSSFYCYAVSSRSEAKKSPTDGCGRDESKGLAVDKSSRKIFPFDHYVNATPAHLPLDSHDPWSVA